MVGTCHADKFKVLFSKTRTLPVCNCDVPPRTVTRITWYRNVWHQVTVAPIISTRRRCHICTTCSFAICRSGETGFARNTSRLRFVLADVQAHETKLYFGFHSKYHVSDASFYHTVVKVGVNHSVHIFLIASVLTQPRWGRFRANGSFNVNSRVITANILRHEEILELFIIF